MYSMHISSMYTCQLSAHSLVCEPLSVVVWRAVPVSLLQQILLCIPLGTWSLAVHSMHAPVGLVKSQSPCKEAAQCCLPLAHFTAMQMIRHMRCLLHPVHVASTTCIHEDTCVDTYQPIHNYS